METGVDTHTHCMEHSHLDRWSWGEDCHVTKSSPWWCLRHVFFVQLHVYTSMQACQRIYQNVALINLYMICNALCTHTTWTGHLTILTRSALSAPFGCIQQCHLVRQESSSAPVRFRGVHAGASFQHRRTASFTFASGRRCSKDLLRILLGQQWELVDWFVWCETTHAVDCRNRIQCTKATFALVPSLAGIHNSDYKTDLTSVLKEFKTSVFSLWFALCK